MLHIFAMYVKGKGNQQVDMYGNMHQVAYEIFKAIELCQ